MASGGKVDRGALRPSRWVLQGVRHAVGDGEVFPQASRLQCQVGDLGVVHQPQCAVFSGSEFVGFEQHGYPDRCEELHTIKVHHHDVGDGQLFGQDGGQLRRGQRVDLAYYGDHASVGAVLDDVQIQDVRWEVAAHIPTIG
jgi:hypothetical protein